MPHRVKESLWIRLKRVNSSASIRDPSVNDSCNLLTSRRERSTSRGETSKEGWLAPADSMSGGKPPFLTCSFNAAEFLIAAEAMFLEIAVQEFFEEAFVREC